MAARPPLHPDAALGLALAVVSTSATPLLLLDGELNVVAASRSFCRAFQLSPATVTGPILGLGEGEWNLPKLQSLLTATAAGHAEIEAYEVDLTTPRRGARRLVLNAHKLDYGDAAETRLLLSVADVTDARAMEKFKDDLLRQKAILLQEIQHRVANSLQIIASVLLQSARQIPSEEARGHLTDAHNRVLSIASVQQQLAASSLTDVDMRAYLNQLCLSLGASMIRDHGQLSIEVRADDGFISPDTSISMGLIVTELVINALKHAFPASRKGRILVDYAVHGPNWTLSVDDNGVGMPKDPAAAKPGLGTSIVEALAHQLDAKVHVTDSQPGTKVAIVHTRIALVGDATAAAV